MHFLYEDHVLPYVSDAPDTVSFVCEEDFRMYEREEAIGPSEVARSAADLASDEPFPPGRRPLQNWLSELYARRLRQTPLVGADVAAEINVPSGEDWAKAQGAFSSTGANPRLQRCKQGFPRSVVIWLES